MQHKSLKMSLIWQVTNYKKPYQVLCSYYTRHENLWQTVRFAFIPFTQQHFDSPSADTSILIASYISPPSVRISWQAEFNADVILRYLRGYISFFRCFSRSLFFCLLPSPPPSTLVEMNELLDKWHCTAGISQHSPHIFNICICQLLGCAHLRHLI